MSELQGAYPGALRADAGGVALVKIPALDLPDGCKPPSTEALVVLDTAQPKPRLLLRTKPVTPAGVCPRNVSPETVAGEAWFGFSYNVSWDEARHSAVQFVLSALRRFAKNE